MNRWSDSPEYLDYLKEQERHIRNLLVGHVAQISTEIVTKFHPQLWVTCTLKNGLVVLLIRYNKTKGRMVLPMTFPKDLRAIINLTWDCRLVAELTNINRLVEQVGFRLGESISRGYNTYYFNPGAWKILGVEEYNEGCQDCSIDPEEWDELDEETAFNLHHYYA